MRTNAQETSIDAYRAHRGSGKCSQQRERVLSFIKAKGGDWSIGELARALGMDKSTVSARRWELINETFDLELKPERKDKVSGVRIQPVGLPAIGQMEFFQ